VIDEKHEILKERMKDEMRTEKNGNVHNTMKYSAHVNSGMLCAVRRENVWIIVNDGF